MGVKTQWGRLGCLLLFGLGIASTQGCAPQLVDSKVRDSHAILVGGAMVFRQGEVGDIPRRGQPGLEFAYDYQSAQGQQQLHASEFVQYNDNTPITGEQRVTHNASVGHFHIAYNRLWAFGPHFELEPFVGGFNDAVNIETIRDNSVSTTTEPDRISLKTNIVGVVVGVTPRFNLNRYVGAQLTIRGAFGFSSRDDSVMSYTSRTGGDFLLYPSVFLRMGSHFMLSAGYAARSQSVETGSGRSNLDLSISGGALTAHLTF